MKHKLYAAAVLLAVAGGVPLAQAAPGHAETAAVAVEVAPVVPVVPVVTTVITGSVVTTLDVTTVRTEAGTEAGMEAGTDAAVPAFGAGTSGSTMTMASREHGSW